MAVWDLFSRLRDGRDVEMLAARIAETVEPAIWKRVSACLPGMSRAEARGYVFAKSGVLIHAEVAALVRGATRLGPSQVIRLTSRARTRLVQRVLRRSLYLRTATNPRQRRAA